MRHENELNSWRVATVGMVLLAALAFFIQHFVARSFDVALEICIFYIPAVSIAFLFLYFRRKLKS